MFPCQFLDHRTFIGRARALHLVGVPGVRVCIVNLISQATSTYSLHRGTSGEPPKVLFAQGLRDFVARLIFVMVHIQGVTNLADILTKPQSAKMCRDLMRYGNLRSSFCTVLH